STLCFGLSRRQRPRRSRCFIKTQSRSSTAIGRPRNVCATPGVHRRPCVLTLSSGIRTWNSSMTFRLESPAFADGQVIPAKYTADGDDLSPPLKWFDPPEGTRSFALIVEDPDVPSGTFLHWGLYNIMGARTLLPEGIGRGPKTEKIGKGINDFDELR